jgi:hypothetical protein
MQPPWLCSAINIADSDFFVAIGLLKNQNGTFHSGIFYRIEDIGKIFFLHVAHHNVFKNEDVTSGIDGHFVIPPLPKIIARSLAVFCKTIASAHANGDFPYSFRLPESKIWTTEGRLAINGLSNGLTCSHFVLSVFSCKGIEILCRNEWPYRHEDKTHQMNFIAALHLFASQKAVNNIRASIDADNPEVLPKHIMDHEAILGHIHGMIKEIGSLRYAPIEIAAGASAVSIPASYRYTEATVRALKPLL